MINLFFSENADNIDPKTIKIYKMSNKTGEVIVYWEEPKEPNGLILSYDIQYSKVMKDVRSSFFLKYLKFS